MFVGAEVKIRTFGKIDGRRRFKGRLLSCEADVVKVDVEGTVFDIDLSEVDEARLVPEY